jgi:hypothetical protein
MKVSIHSVRIRKLQAVINHKSSIVYFRGSLNKVCLLQEGVVSILTTITLEEIMAEGHPDRHPIYEGETIAITF